MNVSTGVCGDCLRSTCILLLKPSKVSLLYPQTCSTNGVAVGPEATHFARISDEQRLQAAERNVTSYARTAYLEKKIEPFLSRSNLSWRKDCSTALALQTNLKSWRYIMYISLDVRADMADRIESQRAPFCFLE